MEISDKDFGRLIENAVAGVPSPFKDRLENVAFLVENDPSPAQRQKLNLYPNETLFGLYEGVPLPARGGTTKILPDKITIFKNPILAASKNMEDLQEQINHTIWHEVAHYFGLDHERIHELENKGKRAARDLDSFQARRDEEKP